MSESAFDSRAFRARSAIGVPLAYAAAAVALGMLVPRLESHFFPDLTAKASATRCSTSIAWITAGPPWWTRSWLTGGSSWLCTAASGAA